MEQPQLRNLFTLESNVDQLIRELHQLASRIKPSEPYPSCDPTQVGQGQYLIATGRS